MYGQQIPEGQQIAFQKIRIHMRELSPDQMGLKIANTPFGPRYYFQGAAWNKYGKLIPEEELEQEKVEMKKIEQEKKAEKMKDLFQ